MHCLRGENGTADVLCRLRQKIRRIAEEIRKLAVDEGPVRDIGLANLRNHGAVRFEAKVVCAGVHIVMEVATAVICLELVSVNIAENRKRS